MNQARTKSPIQRDREHVEALERHAVRGAFSVLKNTLHEDISIDEGYAQVSDGDLEQIAQLRARLNAATTFDALATFLNYYKGSGSSYIVMFDMLDDYLKEANNAEVAEVEDQS